MGTVEGAALGAPGRAPAAAGPRTCIRSFRASPDQVREARRFLAQVLGDCPTAADAVARLSELVTNSVLYSNSRRPKGRFIVRACLRPEHLDRRHLRHMSPVGRMPWITAASLGA